MQVKKESRLNDLFAYSSVGWQRFYVFCAGFGFSLLLSGFFLPFILMVLGVTIALAGDKLRYRVEREKK